MSRPRSAYLAPAVATVAWGAVLLQCWLSLAHALARGLTVADGIVDFLGYFTITTNLLVCIALTARLIAPRSAAGRFFAAPFAAGGIATSIAFVAVSYHVLLRTVWNPQGAQRLADVLLHYAVPVLYLVYWFVETPRGSLRWRYATMWGVYPTFYFAYVLVRGGLIGRYPYGFIDVAAIGYRRTLINAVALLLVFIGMGAAFVAVNRCCGRHETARRARIG